MAKKSKVTQEEKVVKITELIDNPDNPNVHPEEQIKALAKSMDRYGQYYPIVVDESMTILCGHGKKEALLLNKATEAKVVIMRGLSDAQKKKLLLEDNKIQTLSFVNYDKVEEIIRNIGEGDIIGFNDDFVNTIINGNGNATVDNFGIDYSEKPDAAPQGGTKGGTAEPARTVPENQEQVSEEKAQEQEETMEAFSHGTSTARTIICPHCGKEIVL